MHPNKQETARANGRTVFLKTVRSAPVEPIKGKLGLKLRCLKWAGGNVKIGGWMKKGRWAGMPVFSLTLEERKTCPLTCQRWNSCYGDNMFLATRHNANRALDRAIVVDCKTLSDKYPSGFIVRLHVLGDFPTVEYVKLWEKMLARHPALRIYGYTHWQAGTAIGDVITSLVVANSDRVSILRSDSSGQTSLGKADPLPPAMVIPAGSLYPDPRTNVICPNETGKVDSCGDCGLCMNGRTSVSFLDHSHAETVKKSLRARGLPVLSDLV